MARAVLTAPPWQLVPGASLPAPDRRVQEPIDSREVDEDAVFASDGAEEASVDEAVRAAEVVLKKLREQLDSSLRSCVYPFGTVTVTSDIDHDLGLALDPAPELSDSFTIHRAYGGGVLDVCMFEAQPRSTLVCFTHDASADDVSVGLRARALLLRDIYWCERDDSSDAPSEEEIGPDGRLAVASIPAVSLQPPSRADPPLQAAPQAPVLGRARWASAPEVETLVGELIGTREQVLACLALQAAFRARIRAGTRPGTPLASSGTKSASFVRT